MFFIPGQVISFLTFPGVIVHEFSHRVFAYITGVPVYEVCYFRLGNPSGYVLHGKVENLKQSFLISTGPIVVNSILCSIVGFFSVYLKHFEILSAILAWLSISIGMHAFPSNQDMKSFVETVNETTKRSLLYFLARLLELVFKFINALRLFWIDLLYAACMMQLIPFLLGSV